MQNIPPSNSYILIDKQGNIKFFCDLKKVSKQIKKNLKNQIYWNKPNRENSRANSKKKFIVDRNTCSYYFENIICLVM